MKISKKIKETINKLPAGTTFKYRELDISNNEYGAATKTIGRLIAEKAIKRISTGVFYKPKKTVFGELKPGEENLLRPYLFIGNNRIAYITGTALYNRMGLTSQVPKDIKVASKVKEIRTRIGNINVRRVKSYIDVTSMNYHLLEILDALKDFKQIPDLDRKAAIKILITAIISLKKKELLRLLQYVYEYPPRTRAFLGALLEEINVDLDLDYLKQSLNPLTEYKLGIIPDMLSTAEKWNIK
ncbi:MAG: DUF6088 family protein [Desulfobacula sp.]|uniref:DUF6088 family protein n=1 Tax=Desulfobacula sp. TaxID=2593537 RepID=UPI0025C1C7D5|nr:DUF6088 family protein [Desulfobacula sp.]MCD4721801.1 DUF6088 family protein [Desulfobacula sp.]